MEGNLVHTHTSAVRDFPHSILGIRRKKIILDLEKLIKKSRKNGLKKRAIFIKVFQAKFVKC